MWNGTYAGKPAGSPDPDGYLLITIDSVKYKAHRLLWAMVNGPIPDNMMIDHINGVTSDNRLWNLRLATRSNNQHNSKFRKNNTSGFKGVSWDKGEGKWQAGIVVGGKRKALGRFATPEEAYHAYCRAAKALHGQYARTS